MLAIYFSYLLGLQRCKQTVSSEEQQRTNQSLLPHSAPLEGNTKQILRPPRADSPLEQDRLPLWSRLNGVRFGTMAGDTREYRLFGLCMQNEINEWKGIVLAVAGQVYDGVIVVSVYMRDRSYVSSRTVVYQKGSWRAFGSYPYPMYLVRKERGVSIRVIVAITLILSEFVTLLLGFGIDML